MEDEIINKLKKALSEQLEESKVVYIMVEIRKILENNTNNYPLLRFYCHWVLHPKINKLSAIREILNKIAEEHKAKDFGGTNIDFVNFSHLHKEMKIFFKEKDLPIDLLEDPMRWREFKRLLINIIRDCPLEVGKNYKPVLIEKFVLKECKEGIHNGFNDFTIDWEYKLVDNDTTFKASSTEILEINKRTK